VHISFDPRNRGEIMYVTFANGVPKYEKKKKEDLIKKGK
jgi:hypothetical protein